MNQEQRKLQAQCANTGMLLRVAFWLCILILFARVGVLLWACSLPAGQFQTRSEWDGTVIAVNGLGVLSHTFSAETAAPAQALAHAKTTFLIGAWTDCLAFAVICAVLWQIRSLFKGIDENGAPFRAKNVKGLRCAGLLLVFRGFLPYLVQILFLMIFGLWGGTVFDGLAMKTALLWFFVGAVVLCLARIFHYGCALQTESDETL